MKTTHCFAIEREDGSIIADSRCKSEVELTALYARENNVKVVRVKIEEHKKRSLTASALFHVWCKQLSGFMGEPENIVKQILKIKFGYHIILAEADETAVILEYMMTKCGWDGLSWTQKLKLSHMIPCTSVMSTKQLREFMDTIQNWAMSEHNVTLDNGKRE